jgi:hypothetical protein
MLNITESDTEVYKPFTQNESFSHRVTDIDHQLNNKACVYGLRILTLQILHS